MTDSGQPLRRAPRFIRNLHSQSVRRHADVKLSCKISDVRVLNNLLKIRSLKMLVVLVGSSKKLDQLGRLFAILSFGNTKLLIAAQDVRVLNNLLKIRSLKMLVVLVGSSKKLDQLGRLFAILSFGNTKPLNAIQGNPEPEVLWYKNGKQFTEIKEIVQYEIKEDHQVHTLHFIRCTEEDAAVYQISARNSLGMISGSAIIEVGPVTKAIIYQRLFRCPAKNTQTSSRNNSIKCIEGPAKGEPRLANAQEEHKDATSTPAALSSPITAQTHDQKPSDSQNTSTVGSHREQKSLHSSNTPDTFMAKRPKNKNRKRQPINSVILDEGGAKEAHSKALAQRPNPEGHRETTHRDNNLDLRIFEESDLCEPVTRPASEGHTRCVRVSEQEDPKAHFGSAKKTSPADERLVNDSGQLGRGAVRGGQCQETGQVGTARSAPERQPIDDVSLKEEVCVCVQETHHTNDVTLLNKGALTGPENHIGEVTGLNKDNCLAASENHHRTDDVRPKKGDSTIGPKIHFADDVNLNEGGCCITVSESEPADDSRMSREGCVTFSESYHARDVSLSQESCVSAPKNHLTDKVQLSKEGCFTAPQSECADDVRSGKEEDFMTGSESHPLDDVSLSNVAGIPATKSYNADDVTDFSRKFCTTAPECRHARDARQKKRDYMIGPESHRDDDVRLRKEDSMMGLEKRHADDVSLNQQVRLNGYDHYPSDWPVWQGVSGDTVTRGPPIGLCDNQSDSGEAAAKGARPEGTHPDPGTDMVLSAGHRQQHDLPPLKAHKRVKLAVAIQNDSAAIEEGGRGGRKAAGGCAPPVPHASDEVREASGDPLLAEEVTKLMTEKTTVEGLSEGSPMGTPARRPAKEDGSKTRKVNSAGGRCDPTLNKSSLENEVTTLAGGTGNCREIAMDPGSCVLQQQTATHRATPVTLHIEELDVANHCEGRSGLPDTATACSANAVQEIPMMCEMDFAGSTNVMCHLVTEDPTALIVPPLTESGNMSPSSKLCNDSCAGSEGLGFLHGDCKGSSSPPQVKQCVCDDKDIDCHCVCENPETAIVENPIFYSFDRDSDINIVINNQFSKEVPPLFIESAGDKMEYIGHMECSDGKMKSIEHIESVESKRGSIVHGEEVSRTYQEEGLPIPGVQAVHVSVFHSDEIAAEEAVYHLLTNDACDRLSDDFEQGLIEDICPSSSNYDKTSIIISDTVAEHYPPCRSVDCYEVAHCTDTHSSYLKTLFYLNQEPASSICTESADCFLNSNQPAQVGESVLDGFNQVPSSITFDFGQSDQVQQNHSQLPQLLVLETPNGTFINESDGQLIDEIKTLFEVFRQSLEESIQGQRHDLGLSMQEDSSGCPAQISLNSKDSDINFNSSTQVNSPCADTQNLVDKSEEVTDVDAQGKGAFGNCSEISITMSIKALMEEYMLNEHVLDSFNDKPDSIQYLEADSEVPSERKFPLLDHSETDDSIEQVNADAEWALIEKERVKQLQETTTECHSEEPEMSQPFSVCQICTREPSPVQDSDITTANISWDAGGDVSDSDSINKTHAQDVVTTRDPQSPEAFPDQKKNSFMDAMKTYEYLVNSEQPPDLSQLCTIKAPCNSSMDVDSDVVQDMFHTEVECENKSVFYVCSEDLTSNSCTSYISDNKHQLSSLCNHRESIEHSLPLPAMEKTKVSVQLPNTEIKMAVLTTCNAEEQVPLHQSENKGQEECLEMPSAKDVLVSLPSSLRTIPSIQKELELGSDFKDVCVRSHKDGPSNLVENLSTLPEDTQPGAADYLPSSNKGLALHFQCSQSTFQSTPLVLELDKKELKEGGICLLENTLKEEAIIKERKLEHEINEGLSIENEKAPQSLDDIDVHTSQHHSENMQLSNHFPEIHNDVAITNGSELVSQVTKSTDKESPASLNITQISRAEKEVYNCSQKEYENMETEMGVTSEELDPFPGYPCTEGGEEIEFNQLFFRDDFISDSYFSGNIHGKIATEELHFGEGVHRKAFRSKVIYGLVPVFRPGHVCVLKVHNAVAYGTKTTDELIQRNYKLAAQECYVQNTAREYAKMYAAEAEHLEDFGRVPEIIPIFLIHRLANHIPYATVEEELVGDFVKYSIRDGKEINFMRRDSEAGQKCCTFQHWVFQKTSGNLLVTDMQGVGMKLTDVGIATLAKGYKGFKGNCSISFIEQFKVLHLCNKYCEMLGLKSLQKQKKPGAAKTKAPPTPSASSRKTVGGARPKGKR